jgi:hypothetical protein
MQTKLAGQARRPHCLEKATMAQGAMSLSRSPNESVWQATFRREEYIRNEVRSSLFLRLCWEPSKAARQQHRERLPKHETARGEHKQ